MATKVKPIKRFNRRDCWQSKHSHIRSLIADLESSDEQEIIDRLRSRLSQWQVRKRGTGIEAVLRDSITAPRSKVSIDLYSPRIIRFSGNFTDSVTYHTNKDHYDFKIPYHLRNVIRRHKQGKIKL